MTIPRLSMTGRTTLLTGVVLLLAAGTVAAQPGGWRSHIHIGPPASDPFALPDSANGSFTKWFPPDYGPYPESWSHWPTLHEALDEYGLFGRRARGHAPARFPVAPPTVEPTNELLPPPRLAEPAPAAALLRVLVPADADLWFDGRPSTRTGAERLFVTPPLESGHGYVYEIRARWPGANNTRAVHVRPGDRVTIDFHDNER